MYLTEEWLDYEKALGFRPQISGSVEEIRTAYSALSESIREKLPAHESSLKVLDFKITGDVSVRIYTPAAASPTNKLPLGVYAHGGGFVAGSVDASFEDYNCRYIARNVPCIIVSVDFRLAPEFLVPTQVDDCLVVYKWAFENCDKLYGDKTKCFPIGASVGGGLALSVALKLIEANMKSAMIGVVALAPITLHPDFVPDEFKETFVSYSENAAGPLIDRAAMYLFNEHNGATKMKDDPYVFPALHPRKADLPPVYFATCGADPLRDDGVIYQQALQKFGIKTMLDNYPGLPHFFWIFPEIQAGELFRANTVKGVRFILRG